MAVHRDARLGQGFERQQASAEDPRIKPLRLQRVLTLAAFVFSLIVSPRNVHAQVNYVVRFTLEREKYFAGEPVFVTFTIQNTGAEPFGFSYRPPARAPVSELEDEPRFSITDEEGRNVPDPAPRPCGGAKGTVVYGSVQLPAGQSHSERWLLNEWARFSRAGHYHVRAERRLPLLSVDPATGQLRKPPVAYALAVNDLSIELETATSAQLEAAFRPYAEALASGSSASREEALAAIVALPQPFLLKTMTSLLASSSKGAAVDRARVLQGLARLGTPAAWQAILAFARGAELPASRARADALLRGYAVLLLGESGDAAFVAPLVSMLSSAPEELRADILRSLGLFRNPRANQVLFERLHSPAASDRMNSILGLKNLDSPDAIPAILAMLNDPAPQVRQVANFALEGLTGRKTALTSAASKEESARVAADWHAWWKKSGGNFTPRRSAGCRDW